MKHQMLQGDKEEEKEDIIIITKGISC